MIVSGVYFRCISIRKNRFETYSKLSDSSYIISLFCVISDICNRINIRKIKCPFSSIMFKFYGIFSQSESRHRCIHILRILKQFVYEMSRIRIKFIQ